MLKVQKNTRTKWVARTKAARAAGPTPSSECMAEPLEVTLIRLMASGDEKDRQEAETLAGELNIWEQRQVRRSMTDLENMMDEVTNAWRNIPYEGKGVDMPDPPPRSSHIARPRFGLNPVLPFSAAAERLGNALADVVDHPDCPDDLARWISDLDCNVANERQDLGIQLRTRFVALIAKAGEKKTEETEESEQPALRAA